MGLGIYVPSRSRADCVHTLKQFPKQLLKDTFLVCPQSQTDEYLLHNPQCKILGIEYRNLGEKRNKIFQHARDNYDKLIMLDDDLRFSVRRKDKPDLFSPPKEGDMVEMFRSFSNLLNKVSHAGILMREGANRILEPVKYTSRVCRAFGYRTDIDIELDFEGNRDKGMMCDFYITLLLLTKGYNNAVLCSYVHNQTGSNTKGGCSDYRTKELQERAAINLASRFPEFVTLVKKVNKKGDDWWKDRTDVKIQWKKAYLASREIGR